VLINFISSSDGPGGVLRWIFFSRILGPKSKYEKDLPYTYEAQVKYLEDDEDSISHIADTICGLVAYLDERKISPDDVRIFEIHCDQEKELDIAMCTSMEQKWLSREELCESFKHYYEGHIYEGGCTFSDRDNTCK
jgi:hypothetical protein